MALTLEQMEARLAGHTPPYPKPGRRAAVAALVRFDLGRPEVLLMKRSERPGDRWSGHVSFPGGREEAGDPDLLATAVRETLEEVGIDLRQSARLLGRLEAIHAVARGKILPMTITPFVFTLVADAPLTLREEAESAFWLPLDQAADGGLDDVYTYRLGPFPLKLPCWRYERYIVWGLTYQMLRGLLDVVGGGQ